MIWTMDPFCLKASDANTVALGCEGMFGDEPSLPVATFSNPAIVFSPDNRLSFGNTTHSEDISLSSESLNTDSAETFPSRESSLDTEDGDCEAGDQTFTNFNNQPYGGSSSYANSTNPTARIYCQLSQMLQDKVNLEMEEFRYAIHGLLEEQHSHVQQLLSITEPPQSMDTKDESEPCKTNFQPMESHQTTKTEDNKEKENSECLVQLLTYSSIITRALQREEYLT